MNLKKQEKLFAYLARYFDSMTYPPVCLYGKIGRERIKEGWRRRVGQILKGAADYPGLYIHIPYCQSRCFFCKFMVRVANSSSIIERYLECLRKEIGEFSPLFKKIAFKTLYLGGGTPTILSESQMDGLLTLLEKKFNLKDTYQRLIEATPATLSREKIKILQKHGINRLTIGIQVLDEALAARINRANQTKEMVERVYAQARSAKIAKINIDLVVGLPGQSKNSFLSDVDFVLKLRPDAIHIFAYEEDRLVIFCKMGKRINDADRAKRDEMFAIADKKISKSGYRTYKGESYILNFAASNYQFLLRYYANGSILGLGAQASSYIPGYYSYENPSLEEYLARRSKARLPSSVEGYSLNRNETAINYVINNIRGGLDKGMFRKLYGIDFDKIFCDSIDSLRTLGRLQEEGEIVRLIAESDEDFRTYSKFFFSPQIINKLEEKMKRRLRSFKQAPQWEDLESNVKSR